MEKNNNRQKSRYVHVGNTTLSPFIHNKKGRQFHVDVLVCNQFFDIQYKYLFIFIEMLIKQLWNNFRLRKLTWKNSENKW